MIILMFVSELEDPDSQQSARTANNQVHGEELPKRESEGGRDRNKQSQRVDGRATEGHGNSHRVFFFWSRRQEESQQPLQEGEGLRIKEKNFVKALVEYHV